MPANDKVFDNLAFELGFRQEKLPSGLYIIESFTEPVSEQIQDELQLLSPEACELKAGEWRFGCDLQGRLTAPEIPPSKMTAAVKQLARIGAVELNTAVNLLQGYPLDAFMLGVLRQALEQPDISVNLIEVEIIIETSRSQLRHEADGPVFTATCGIGFAPDKTQIELAGFPANLTFADWANGQLKVLAEKSLERQLLSVSSGTIEA